MCMTTKECILTWAREYWPPFNKRPYSLDDLFKIVEREKIHMGLYSSPYIEYEDELKNLSFNHDNWMFVNACGSVPNKGDTLVFDYAKLFHWYYINDPNFQNFHNCMMPPDEQYGKLCLTAGFLAVIPSRVLIEDLREDVDLTKKYRLSRRFAYRRTQLLLNYLLQLDGRKSQKDLRKVSGEEGVFLCRRYLDRQEQMLKMIDRSRFN